MLIAMTCSPGPELARCELTHLPRRITGYGGVEEKMSDREITRRQALQVTAAFFVGAGLTGCGSRRREMAREPAPTLGWETIASGNTGPGPRSRHGLV